ncbi:TraR/DksA C4-type zinc finger protein [Roseospira goensis]|uniref:Phage/conjugal plasmid C-4 type zinc finger TraR family protein n=1 Tax=Roseospira goensis TaxID=391922 RepID=A0A7W6S452_9PROT|nr:TraR/DksA C4-type zinc finger protein [Roseospira goensis]MBB4287784.1 phage/conjugal plasmid C-4 type zinc finger TraR family protein [Roseospira goensis]
MADLIDIVTDRVEAERETLLARHRAAQARARPRPTAATPATACAGCGQPIPPARRQARPGSTRCAACQAAHEVRQARRHRTGV